MTKAARKYQEAFFNSEIKKIEHLLSLGICLEKCANECGGFFEVLGDTFVEFQKDLTPIIRGKYDLDCLVYIFEGTRTHQVIRVYVQGVR